MALENFKKRGYEDGNKKFYLEFEKNLNSKLKEVKFCSLSIKCHSVITKSATMKRVTKVSPMIIYLFQTLEKS